MTDINESLANLVVRKMFSKSKSKPSVRTEPDEEEMVAQGVKKALIRQKVKQIVAAKLAASEKSKMDDDEVDPETERAFHAAKELAAKLAKEKSQQHHETWMRNLEQDKRQDPGRYKAVGPDPWKGIGIKRSSPSVSHAPEPTVTHTSGSENAKPEVHSAPVAKPAVSKPSAPAKTGGKKVSFQQYLASHPEGSLDTYKTWKSGLKEETLIEQTINTLKNIDWQVPCRKEPK